MEIIQTVNNSYVSNGEWVLILVCALWHVSTAQWAHADIARATRKAGYCEMFFIVFIGIIILSANTISHFFLFRADDGKTIDWQVAMGFYFLTALSTPGWVYWFVRGYYGLMCLSAFISGSLAIVAMSMAFVVLGSVNIGPYLMLIYISVVIMVIITACLLGFECCNPRWHRRMLNEFKDDNKRTKARASELEKRGNDENRVVKSTKDDDDDEKEKTRRAPRSQTRKMVSSEGHRVTTPDSDSDPNI